ncbi:hypothetical protein PHJA_002418500 [Phtheirospermum japonicum]|uniref:Uncharacterized protein n=1 Tax=Phtheirospermum japonicum TaxID=374723 RepID=A0A830D6K3_9LAMI|nr:hypothetical protein PHJA_002418500 [Phtheirospermum japonicum]
MHVLFEEIGTSIKKQWVVITTNIQPHVKTLTTKSVEIYEISKNAVTPHVIKAQALADPNYQHFYIFIRLPLL